MFELVLVCMRRISISFYCCCVCVGQNGRLSGKYEVSEYEVSL